DVLGVADQPVVGDDRDVVVGRVLQLGGDRGAVDRGDDQQARALGDLVVDLVGLGGDVVLCVLEVDLVAEFLELLLEVVAVVDPALGRAGRHRDADEGALRGLLLRLLVDGLLARPARGHAEREPKAQRQADELSALHVSPRGVAAGGAARLLPVTLACQGPGVGRVTTVTLLATRLLALSLRASTPGTLRNAHAAEGPQTPKKTGLSGGRPLTTAVGYRKHSGSARTEARSSW